MGGSNPAKELQGNRARPKSVAVAVPLVFTQKRAQKAGVTEKDNVTTTEIEDTPSTTASETGNAHNSVITARTQDSQHTSNVTQIADGKHPLLVKESEHKVPLPISTGGQSPSGIMAKTNGTNAALPASQNIAAAKPGLPQASQAISRDAAVAAATIKALRELAEQKRAAAAAAVSGGLVSGASSTQIGGSPPNEDISKVAPNIGDRMMESRNQRSASGLSQQNPAMRGDAVLSTLESRSQEQVGGHRQESPAMRANSDLRMMKNRIQVSFGGLRQESPARRSDAGLRDRLHQSHPSQGSIHFDSFYGSPHSSLAPHGAHQFGPYPPPPQPMHPAMNTSPTFSPGLGYSPQPTPQIMHSPGLNNFARRHHPQSFGPSPNSTPAMEEHQQFQHSHARAAQSFHAQTPPMRAQHPFQSDFAHSPSPGPMQSDNVPFASSPHPPQMAESYTGSPLQPGEAGDNLDGLLDFIQMQFNNATNADHHFQVNFAANDGQQPLPLVLVGHNLLFSRSALLRQLMATDSSIILDSGAPRHLITLNINDRFVRPDSVWIALQRLYGGSLLTIDTLPDLAQSGPKNSGATMETEKFDLALGYAVIGQILQMPPVEQRGAEVASHFLQWSTLLRALDFSEGSIDYELTHEAHGGAGVKRKYGQAAEMLLHTTLSYITINFPPDFQLNTAVTDTPQISRLPASSIPQYKKHHPKLSGMTFGDFGVDDNATSADDHGPATPLSTDAHSILSSTLLNLPFPLLKYVLESPSLGHNTESFSDAKRAHFMFEVVKEREKRRMKAVIGTALIARRGETQQEKTLWWMESVAGRDDSQHYLVREHMLTPFGHEIPA